MRHVIIKTCKFDTKGLNRSLIKDKSLEEKKIRISRRRTKELIKKNQRARGNHNESN